MIENIQEKQEEVKNFWEKNKDTMTATDIFRNFKDYFDTSFIQKNPDWAFFIRWLSLWKRKEKKEVEATLTDEQVKDLQSENMKRSIVFLNNLLKEYEENPERLKFVKTGEVIRLLKAIESSEQAREKTKIEQNKLKLDTFKTFFPYQRLSINDLEKLKDEIINAIGEFKQLGVPETISVEPAEGGSIG